MSDKLLNTIKSLLQNKHSKIGLIEDASIKFGGMAYPKSGWAIFTCGGPGSGKSYTIRNQFLIDAKILDSDILKELYVKLLEKIVNSPTTDLETRKRLLEPYGGKLPDMRNSKHVDELHKYVTLEKRLFIKALKSFLKSSGKRLQNFIIDTTGNNINGLILNAHMFKDLGYKVALVWIITNIDLARLRNKTRDRVVTEEYLEQVHNKILNTIPKIIREGSLDVLDELWIVFNKNTGEGEFRSRFKDTAFKLEKMNGHFVLTDQILQKITQHAKGGEATNDQTNREKI